MALSNISKLQLVDESYEQDLAARLEARDPGAWTILYSCFFDPLYAYVLMRVNMNHSIAEDIVQDVFLSAVESLQNFNSQYGTLYGWLRGIARHHVFRYYQVQQKNMDFIVLLEKEIEVSIQNVEGGHDTYRRLIQQEERLLIESVLNALPSHYRDVLLEKYTQDKSVKELAQKYQTTPKSIEMMLYHARQLFKNIYHRITKER